MKQDVYSGFLKLNGEENLKTLQAASNYARCLKELSRFEEAKALFRKTIPVARRILAEGHKHTLKMRGVYAVTLYLDPAATLDDLREAVTTLEEIERISRRVFGGAHPFIGSIEQCLKSSRAVLGAREELDEVENMDSDSDVDSDSDMDSDSRK